MRVQWEDGGDGSGGGVEERREEQSCESDSSQSLEALGPSRPPAGETEQPEMEEKVS